MVTNGTDHDVVVVGGGPTGMMLAAELAIAGVDALIVERRRDQHLDGSRGGGLHARTLEVLAQRGVADRFIEAGTTHPAIGFGGIQVDVSDLPTRHNYVLALWQRTFEPILADWVDELGVTWRRGCEVTGLSQDDDGVAVQLSSGATVRAGHLIGCDGGRSPVRKSVGIDFVGLNASTSWLIAEAVFDDQPEFGFRLDADGRHAIGPSDEPGRCRVVLVDPEVKQSPQVDVDELRGRLVDVYGTDFGLKDATWLSRFTDLSRQAATYRRGRVLLGGDAAHVHPPLGGQGLNTGVQDAVNLGWKLAQVVRGGSTEALLDTYESERHPVAARVLHNTEAQVALTTSDDRHASLRDTVGELLAMDEPRHHIAAMITGLDVRYDCGEGSPLLGRRVPDLDLATTDGPTTVFALLHDARPVLLDLGDHARADRPRLNPRIHQVKATCRTRWTLPVIGEVATPEALLIRPDGHVVWTGDPTDHELAEVAATWFGKAT